MLFIYANLVLLKYNVNKLNMLNKVNTNTLYFIYLGRVVFIIMGLRLLYRKISIIL